MPPERKKLTDKQRQARMQASNQRGWTTFGEPYVQMVRAAQQYAAAFPGQENPFATMAQQHKGYLTAFELRKAEQVLGQPAGTGAGGGSTGRPLPGSMGGLGSGGRGGAGGGRAGGGRPGGGGGGGGGRGGGGGKGGKKFQQAASSFLAGLGIPGNFRDLVRRAIVQGWDMDQFANALIRTKPFKRAFPGLVQNGQLHVDFAGGAAGGASAVLNAVGNYKTAYDDFQAAAQAAGYSGQIDKKLFGFATRQDISVQEFGQRLVLINNLAANPGLLDMVNEQREFDGLTPYANEGELLKAAATNDPDFVDNYQAAWLRNQGLNIGVEAAAQFAQSFDSPLAQDFNFAGRVGPLLAEVRRIKGQIQPELDAEGLTDEVLFNLSLGQDPGGYAETLEGILNRRRTQAQTALQRSNVSARQSTTGGFSIIAEDEARSY